MVSLGLLRVVCLDFCMELISSSAKSFGEGGQIHRALSSGFSDSAGDEKLFHIIPDTLALPLLRDMDWLKCQLRIQ